MLRNPDVCAVIWLHCTWILIRKCLGKITTILTWSTFNLLKGRQKINDLLEQGLRFPHPMTEWPLFVRAMFLRTCRRILPGLQKCSQSGELNSISSEKQCLTDLLDNPNVHELKYWLSRFVTEVRKHDGQPSIQQTLSGLQRRMLEGQLEAPKFMHFHEDCFGDLHKSCDTVYRDLHNQGTGKEVRRARTFSP